MATLNWLLKYPTIIKDSSNKLDGFLRVKGKLFRLQMICPNFPSTKEMKISVSGQNRLKVDPLKYEDIFLFMADLEKELAKDIPKVQHRFNKEILDRLCSLQEEFKFEINSDLTKVKLVEIPNFDDHFLEFEVDPEGKLKICSHSLPDSVPINTNVDSIKNTISEFITYLGHLEELYANLSSIDELCFVIAPIPATTKSNYRIVKFSNKVFMKIILDPFSPSTVRLEFIGPTEEVINLRQKYNDKIGDWDLDTDVYSNILRMFDLTFLPYHVASEKEQRDCSICFQFNVDNSYPIMPCYNDKCDAIFHIGCLKKWFSTQDETKTFYTIATGICPYCKQKMTTLAEIE